VVICFNFRTDRLRQLTIALTQEDFPEQSMKKLNLKYYTMSNYDKSFKGIQVIYDKQDVSNTLGEVLAKNGKTQLRIAETEKYAHVTYFFSGGRETLFDHEERIMVSSPKVATYDLQPEMSAPEVADKIVVELNKQKFDFICSFAVHYWLGADIEQYALKLKALLKPEGMVLFESQDIDRVDSDWDDKLKKFMSKGFTEIESGFLKDDGKIDRRFSILKKI